MNWNLFLADCLFPRGLSSQKKSLSLVKLDNYETEKFRYHISFPKFVFTSQQDVVISQHANTSFFSVLTVQRLTGLLSRIQDRTCTSSGSLIMTDNHWLFFPINEKKKYYHRVITDGVVVKNKLMSKALLSVLIQNIKKPRLVDTQNPCDMTESAC